MRDLAAQEAMAVWSFWGLAVALGGIVVTALGTGLLLWQITLTRKAVADTGKATIAMERSNIIAFNAQRPWIRIEPKLVDFELRLSGVTFQWEVAYTNTGQMIAAEFDAEAKFLAMDRDAIGHINRLYEGYRAKAIEPSSFALAPNEVVHSYGNSSNALDHIPWFGSDPERCFMMLVVMVSYLIPGDEERRYACRSFAFGRETKDVMMMRFFTNELSSALTRDSYIVRRYGPGYTT